MPANHRIAARSARDQAFWDAVFIAVYPACVERQELSTGTTGNGAAHMARDMADQALAERRNSQRGVQ